MQSDGGSPIRGRSSTLVNRNVTIRGRRTSLRLEPAMWDALQEIAQREGTSVHELCTKVDLERRESTLTAAIRVFILGYYRAAATAHGHILAGHGYPRSTGGAQLPGAAVRRERVEDEPPVKPTASRRT
jgi:predicted DNA-binding ribbon-helix-helix protein